MKEGKSELYQSEKIALRNLDLKSNEGIELANDLAKLLDKYNDKRALVLGVSCIGKSTLLQHIQGEDMDIIFDMMTPEFRRNILRGIPYEVEVNGLTVTKYRERPFVQEDSQSMTFLRETGSLISLYANKNLRIQPGRPVFGTCLIDTDVVIHLKPDDQTLDHRIESRNNSTRRVQRERVFAMRQLVEEDIEKARKMGLIVEKFYI